MAESSFVPSGTVQTLDLPVSAVKKTTGFAIDFGNSVLKVAYAMEVDDELKLHFVGYPINKVDDALDHIKSAMGNYMNPGQNVSFTGSGSNQHKEMLETKLNVKLTVLNEFDCHIRGFRFLTKHCSVDEIFHKPSSKALNFAPTNAGLWKSAFTAVSKQCNMKLSKMYSEPIPKVEELTGIDKVEFPALVFMLGSAAMSFILNEDGTYDPFGLITMVGMTLLANGTLMADCDTFDELIQLAEKGDYSKVTKTTDAIVNHDADDIYAGYNIGDKFPVLQYGHAVGRKRDDFTREDRAAALVDSSTQSLASQLQMWAMYFKAKHVYFIGGFPSSQLIREELEKYFMYYSLISHNCVYAKPHFIKFSGYLGALGALLDQLGE